MSATTGWFSIITASTGTWIRASPHEVLTRPQTESNRLYVPAIYLALDRQSACARVELCAQKPLIRHQTTKPLKPNKSVAELWYPRRAMIGTTISHYRVSGKLGVGGMGIVYKGEDLRLARSVALKFLPEDLAGDPEAARRLQREAQTIAGLNHPNICTIYEVDEHEGAAFIAMELVEGKNLKLHIAQGPLSTEKVCDIALQITDALSAAHAAGIVHRDIKPGNIVISATGVVKVLDFGLARRFMEPTTGELVIGGSTLLGR